ncbi:hypothetical protein HKCCE3408_04675 [Rhodobacterales bacterium HKCCE3408]|nr:hypothetical protein [Rhodobacterales bacterium HKCCE3408]
MRFIMTQGPDRDWISAEGRIGPGSAAALEAFLASLDTIPTDIVLDSPGGQVREALSIGRTIRAAGLTTHVGRLAGCGTPETATVRPGTCASACAYAFLGGTERFVDSPVFGTSGSLIAFHAVRPAAGQGEIAPERLAAATRAVTAEIAAYVTEMGVDPVLPRMATAVAHDMLFVPARTLRAVLRIDTPREIAEAEPPAPVL